MSAIATAGSPLDKLPPSLVESIFDFSVDGTQTTLHTLAQVSTEWLAYGRTIVTTRASRTFTIEANALTNASLAHDMMLELRDKLSRRADTLRELRVETGGGVMVSRSVCSVVLADARHVDTLQVCPARKDGALVNLESLLHAAMRCCPEVRSLVIDDLYQLTYADTNVAHLEAVFTRLLDASARWTKHGGLRQLSVEIPFLSMEDHTNKATQYVEALANYCPNIEFVGNREGSLPREQWHIGLETWKQFCACCTQLQAFHWGPVPFATGFFEVFGRFPKPKLTQLTLEYVKDWDWDAYHRHLPGLTSGFGESAQHPQVVFTACPALRNLRVVCASVGRVSNDGFLDQGLLSTAFCEALATNCRQLEHFQVVSDDDVTIGAMTDKAMRALATLPALISVDIECMDISGVGLFELVVNAVRTQWTPQRNYTTTVGDGEEPSRALAFYHTASQFLTKLLEWGQVGTCEHDGEAQETSRLPCSNDRLLLRLVNGNPNAMDDWDVQFQLCVDQLVGLIGQVKAHRPELRLRVVAKDPFLRTDGSVTVDAVVEIDLYTPATKLPESEVFWTRASDHPIDDVFVGRDVAMDEYSDGAADSDTGGAHLDNSDFDDYGYSEDDVYGYSYHGGYDSFDDDDDDNPWLTFYRGLL